MGETEVHVTVIFYLFQAFRHFFRRAESTYVAATMLLYYEEGNPGAVIVPDTFVVKGVAKHQRRTYKLWEEKVAPCAAIEVTSRSSRIEDLGTKKGLYEMLGVGEYFVFDPLDEYLEPRFQGFKLAAGFYRPMTPRADGSLESQELGLILRPEGPLLRVVDPATGLPVPTPDEAMERAEEEARRAEDEAARPQDEARRALDEARRADAAEAEIARLRAEIEKLRGRTGG